MTTEQFISEISKYVQKYAPKYNIKVYSPIIAQAVLESAKGTSELAANANNYFGLKYRAGRCPTACGIYYKVGSEQNPDGSYTSSAMQWMKFPDMENGVIGYFDFINISNYSNLKNVTDPEIYLKNIKADGYATSLNYVENLMAVIKSYNLTQYDPKCGTTNMTYKVAIDAGHGSNTAGKRHPDDYREHYSNTYMAFYLEQILSKNGIQTLKVSWNDGIVTDDADVALSTRQVQIKNWGADISISIHANASGDGKTYNSANGIETFYHSTTSYAKDSKELAQKVHNQLIKGTKQTNRGVKASALAMCNCVAMGTRASILVETAFMTNQTESNLLKSDDFCRECAREMAQGIFDYLGVSGNVNVTLTPANSVNTGTTSSSSSSSTQSTPNTSTNKNFPATPFTVTVIAPDLNYRSDASMSGVAKGVTGKGQFTITEVKNGWGKLKSGVGWIYLENASYVTIGSTAGNTSTSTSPSTPQASTSSTYTKTQFIKDVQVAIGAKVDGLGGSETLSKTPTVSKTKNNKHAVVKPIQKYFNSLSFDCGEPDGIAGTKFDTAVKAYQKSHGCVADGEITAQKNTWKFLLGLL